MLKALSKRELLYLDAFYDVNTFTEIMMRDENNDLIIQSDIHLELQDNLVNQKRSKILFPREHGKTTQMLPNAAWRIGHNPNIRIKIISSSDDIALGRGKALREILEHPLYKLIFPNIAPGREWADSRFTVRRETITPEPTVGTYGVMSKATGGRADILYFDDPDDEDVIYSEAIRKRNVDRVKNVWLNLLSPDGQAFILCTPWHEDDICHNLDWPELRFAIEDMNPIWPERWSVEKLEEKKKEIGSIPFARGWGLRVITDETAVIKSHWFNYYHDVPKFSKVGITVDPAIGEKEKDCYTAIGAFGLDKDNHVYLTDLIRERFDFPTALKKIEEMAEVTFNRFGMIPIVGVESVAFQKAIPQMFKAKKKRFPVRQLRAEKSKYMRAEKLGVHAENGRVFLRGENGGVHPSQKVVYDECITFPAGKHNDTVDMLGYGVEMMLGSRRARPVVSTATKK